MKEPVAIINTLSEVIRTGIILAIAFGVSLSQEQFAAIMVFVGAIFLAVQTITTRSRVTPTTKGDTTN
jgi:hypothetical protein